MQKGYRYNFGPKIESMNDLFYSRNFKLVMNAFRTMTRILLKWLWSFSLFQTQWMRWIPRRRINKSPLVSPTSINIIVSQLDRVNAIFSFGSYFYTNKSQINGFSAQTFTVSPDTDDKQLFVLYPRHIFRPLFTGWLKFVSGNLSIRE